MDNIVVITQNVKLDSLHLLREYIKPGSETLVFSTQLIFDNEAKMIEEQLDGKCVFKNFSDFMSDNDFEKCDDDAFQGNTEKLDCYYRRIKKIKNECVVARIAQQFPCENRILVCDDLGLDEDVWLKAGYKKVKCEYFHYNDDANLSVIQKVILRLKVALMPYKVMLTMPRYEADYYGQKHIFYGSMNRIGYRFNISFTKCSLWRAVKDLLTIYSQKLLGLPRNSNIVRMSTLHEMGINMFPDKKGMNLKLIQDGYLPPNYTSKYLRFFGNNIEFYTWDIEGGRTFEYHALPHRIIPFRNKLYLPQPNYSRQVKKVLCVASGAGDWTAVKNRSDEDKMIEAFGKVASKFPDIEFIYRCHPVWVHPLHQGVNSIKRAAEYIHWLNLPNLKISGNIPNAVEDGRFRLSYKRSSFEEDLKDVDIVFGEHSISMIDAAFKNILFCSVNVTGRRDFFEGITAMGFPHCESVEEIATLLNNLSSDSFKSDYEKAIYNYNQMTNKEE